MIDFTLWGQIQEAFLRTRYVVMRTKRSYYISAQRGIGLFEVCKVLESGTVNKGVPLPHGWIVLILLPNGYKP